MPLAAERTEVSLPLARQTENLRGIERIPLGAIPPLAHAPVLPLVTGRFLHSLKRASAPRAGQTSSTLPGIGTGVKMPGPGAGFFGKMSSFEPSISHFQEISRPV